MNTKLKIITSAALAVWLCISMMACNSISDSNEPNGGKETRPPVAESTNKPADTTEDLTQAPDGTNTLPETDAETDVETIPDGGEDTTLGDTIEIGILQNVKFWEDSYAKDGYLFGRVGEEIFPQGTTFPHVLSVDSLEKWQAFYGGLPKNASARIMMNQDFVEGIASYHQAFFAEKALKLIFLEESSGSFRHTVDEVRVDGTEITVSITTHVPYAATTDMAYWCIIIPVDKTQASYHVEVICDREYVSDLGLEPKAAEAALWSKEDAPAA